MVIRLRVVHPLDILPGEVSEQRKDSHGESLEPEDGRCK